MKALRSSFYQFTGSFLAALAIISFITYLTSMVPGWDDEKAAAFILNPAFGIFALLLIILIPVCLTIYSKRHKDFELQQYINFSVLRYVIAFLMLFYGFSKMAGKFFDISFLTQDTRLADVDSFALTWFYFGKSNAQEFIISLLEFVPAILLLFRRTIFLGLILLLPVSMNVMMINTFNHISGLTFPVSVFITLGNCHMLYAWKHEIITFMKSTALVLHPTISKGANIFRLTFKFIVIGIMLIFVAEQIVFKIIITKPRSYFGRNKIHGGFELESLKVNNQIIQPQTGNTKYYKSIYLEHQARWNCILFFNKEFQPRALKVLWSMNTDSVTTFIKKENDVIKGGVDSATKFTGTYKLSGNKLYISGIQYGDTINAIYNKKDLIDYKWFW